jgi:hypothetical protein
MSSFSLRHALAVLTIVLLTSFRPVGAQSPAPGNAGTAGTAFRDHPAWTLVDGVLTTQSATEKLPLASKATLVDSVTSFEYKAPAGASARLFIQGRYGFELKGNGQWQPFSLRFRAPRFDSGFNKVEKAFILEAHNGADLQRNVLLDGPTPGSVWENEDRAGPAFIIVQQGPFSLRNSRHEAPVISSSPARPR